MSSNRVVGVDVATGAVVTGEMTGANGRTYKYTVKPTADYTTSILKPSDMGGFRVTYFLDDFSFRERVITTVGYYDLLRRLQKNQVVTRYYVEDGSPREVVRVRVERDSVVSSGRETMFTWMPGEEVDIWIHGV